MSETAYERGYRVGSSQGDSGGSSSSAATGPRAKGNILLQKYGPLPVWAWMAVGFLAILLVYLWRKNSTSSSATTGAGSSATGTTASSLIPQFVNQVYNEGEPPDDENNGPPKPPPDHDTHDPTMQELEQQGITPITPGQAAGLLKHHQRPYTWNGDTFVPATKIMKGIQYYAGPFEENEILSGKYTGATAKHPVAKHPVHHTTHPPKHHR